MRTVVVVRFPDGQDREIYVPVESLQRPVLELDPQFHQYQTAEYRSMHDQSLHLLDGVRVASAMHARWLVDTMSAETRDLRDERDDLRHQLSQARGTIREYVSVGQRRSGGSGSGSAVPGGTSAGTPAGSSRGTPARRVRGRRTLDGYGYFICDLPAISDLPERHIKALSCLSF